VPPAAFPITLGISPGWSPLRGCSAGVPPSPYVPDWKGNGSSAISSPSGGRSSAEAGVRDCIGQSRPSRTTAGSAQTSS